MNWKKLLSLAWVVLCLPAQLPLWLYWYWTTNRSMVWSFSESFSWALDSYAAFFLNSFVLPLYTLPWFILFVVTCRDWVRAPSGKLFRRMLLIGWGALGIPGTMAFALPLVFRVSSKPLIALLFLLTAAVPYLLLLRIVLRRRKLKPAL